MSDKKGGQKGPKAVSGAESVRFLGAAQITRGGLVLPALEDRILTEDLVAWVDGVEIGRLRGGGRIRAGDLVRLPCSYFPHRSLPCEVRIAEEHASDDAAPGFVLHRADEVEILVGPGTLESVRLEIVNGVLEGAAVNPTNGLGRPPVVCRVNGVELRYASYASARGRDDGGAVLTFRVPLAAADITPSGVSYELLLLPDLTLLGSVAYAAQDPAAVGAALARLHSEVGGLGKRVHLELGRLREERDQHARETEALLEAVFTHVLALAGDADRGAEPSARQDEAAAAFARMAEHATGVPRLAGAVHVRPASPCFVDGWFEVELDERGFDCRWMALEASLLNPQPGRPVESLCLTIGATADSRAPEINAVFDAREASVRVISSANGAPYTVEIVPNQNSDRLCQIVYLASPQAHRVDVERDRRVLTLLAMGATWRYADH